MITVDELRNKTLLNVRIHQHSHHHREEHQYQYQVGEEYPLVDPRFLVLEYLEGGDKP